MKIKLTKVATMLLAAALFAVPSCTDYAPEISEIKGDVKTLQTELTATDAALATLAAYVDDLEEQLNENDAALALAIAAVAQATDDNKKALEAEIAQRKADIENLTKLYNDAKAILDQAVKDIADIKAQMKVDEANIDDLLKRVAVIEDQIKTITAQIEALQADVKTLFNRLQSVVYVPENPEGEAIIGLFFVEKNYKKGADVKKGYESLDATSTFDYVITPAAQAASIEALFNQKAIDIRYNIANVATKASFYADSTFKLNVTGVKSRIEGDKGIITVSAVPVIKGITDVKLAQEVQFNGQSISLSICKASAKEGVASEYEVSSEFVNASVEPVELKLAGVGYYDVEKDVVVKPDTLAIPYTDVDVHAYYKDCEPLFIAFTQRGPQTLTASMLKAAFNVEVPVKFGCPKNYRALLAAGKEEVLPAELAKLVKQNAVDTAKFFEAIPEITIQLDPAATDAQRSKLVGAEEHLVLVVALDSLNRVPTTTKAVIKKAQWTIEGTTCESAEWRADLDLSDDKVVYANGYTNAYHRHDLRMTFVDWNATLKKLKDLGVDITEEIQLCPTITAYEVNEKGEKVAVDYMDCDLMLSPKAEDIYLSVCNFKMGKTYFFDALIDTPSTEVKIPFYFVTTDRNREPMVVNIKDLTYTYTTGNPTQYTYGIVDSLWNIAAERKFASLYGFKKQNFEDEICNYGDHKYVGEISMYINADANTIYVADAVPDSVDSLGFAPLTLVDTVKYTTNWGQKCIITWNLTPTVPAFDLKHNKWLVNAPDSLYDSYYTIPSEDFKYRNNKLHSYDVEASDISEAFYFVKDSTKVYNTPEAANEVGLNAMFVFRKNPVSAGIKWDYKEMLHSKLLYEGSDASVAVMTTLKIDNIAIPSSFDKGGDYYTYQVIKPEFVKTFEPVEDTLTISIADAKEYSVSVKENITLTAYDRDARRTFKLIYGTDDYARDNGHRNPNKVGEFMIGWDSAFSPVVDEHYVADIFGFYNDDDTRAVSPKYELLDVPAQYQNIAYIKDGKFVFDATSQIRVTAPITFKYRAYVPKSKYHGTFNSAKNTGLISEEGTIIVKNAE